MRSWSDRFPSKYLSVDDIRKAGGEVRATVMAVKDENMQDLQHPGTEVSKAILVCDTCKPIVPGKLISKVLVGAYGEEPLSCVGKVVIAFVTDYKGKDIVMLRCLVNGQVQESNPTGGPSMAELKAAQDQLAKDKADFAAQKAKAEADAKAAQEKAEADAKAAQEKASRKKGKK